MSKKKTKAELALEQIIKRCMATAGVNGEGMDYVLADIMKIAKKGLIQ